MVVSQNAFFREADEVRRKREPEPAFAFVGVMEKSASFVLSYLVLKFYEKNKENVIIPFCEKLPPVVLLAKKETLCS